MFMILNFVAVGILSFCAGTGAGALVVHSWHRLRIRRAVREIVDRISALVGMDMAAVMQVSVRATPTSIAAARALDADAWLQPENFVGDMPDPDAAEVTMHVFRVAHPEFTAEERELSDQWLRASYQAQQFDEASVSATGTMH